MDLDKAEKRLDELAKEAQAAYAIFERLSKEHQKLREKIDSEKLRLSVEKHKGITPEYVLSLEWNNITTDVYKQVDRWFWANYSQKGLRHGGAWASTGQIVLQVAFDQNRPFEEQLGILDFLPFIKADQENEKPIGIFEHTCAEFAVWSLCVNPDGTVELLRNRWSERQFKDINEALRHVYDRHPYELKKRKDED